jgi:hypothetical protein
VLPTSREQHIAFTLYKTGNMAAVTNFLTKALSPSYYKQQYKNFLVNSYNYYHPLFRTGRYEMRTRGKCPSMIQIPFADAFSLSG